MLVRNKILMNRKVDNVFPGGHPDSFFLWKEIFQVLALNEIMEQNISCCMNREKKISLAYARGKFFSE